MHIVFINATACALQSNRLTKCLADRDAGIDSGCPRTASSDSRGEDRCRGALRRRAASRLSHVEGRSRSARLASDAGGCARAGAVASDDLRGLDYQRPGPVPGGIPLRSLGPSLAGQCQLGGVQILFRTDKDAYAASAVTLGNGRMPFCVARPAEIRLLRAT